MSKPNKAKRDRYHKLHPERGEKTALIKSKHKKPLKSKFEKKK